MFFNPLTMSQRQNEDVNSKCYALANQIIFHFNHYYSNQRICSSRESTSGLSARLTCFLTERLIDTCVKSSDSIILYCYIWAGTLFILSAKLGNIYLYWSDYMLEVA